MVGALLCLLLARVLTPAEAFAGFANPAPITVAALYVLARAVEKTGLLHPVLARLLGRRARDGISLARLTLPAAGASALLNNTPLVAMLVPPVSDWADRTGQPASRFLMPLSYAVILGGAITLIGTSTNLVVSGLVEQRSGTPLGLFEITPMGLPVALAGLAVLLLTARRLLPDRQAARRDLDPGVAREFTVRMRVEPRGPADGVTIEAAGLRSLQGVFLLQVERRGEVVGPPAAGDRLEGGDELVFVGRVDQVLDLQARRGLVLAEQPHVAGFDTARHAFFEVVVGPHSPLAGRTLREAGFRGRYHAGVVAIHRAGRRIDAKLGAVQLEPGDTLLVLADRGFRDRWRDRGDFLLIAPIDGPQPAATRRWPVVAAVLLGVVVVAGLGVLPMLEASLIAVVLLIVSGVLTAAEARAAVDLEVVIMIAASFALGEAMERTGLADTMAGGVVGAFGGLGPLGALLGVILTTMLVTELVTNNAAAAVVLPLAWSAAERAGQDPRVFAMAVAVMASCSFLTPIGYQTNLMVYGPGGYRFLDYARLGAPITLAVVVTTLLVARWWFGIGG
jgi:di/tricarboxylate transporter